MVPSRLLPDFQSLLEAKAGDLAWFLVSFAVLFLAFSVLFARAKTLSFLRGLLLNVGRIFSSPFIFLHKSTTEIAGIVDGRFHTATVAGQEQYLINRILLIARGGIAVVAISILSLGVIKGCNDFPPSEGLRKQEAAIRKELEADPDAQKNAQATVDRQDKEWAEKKANVLAHFEEKRKTTLEEQKRNLAADELKASSNPGETEALQQIKAFLGRSPASTAEETRTTFQQSQRLISLLNAPDMALLYEYTSTWLTIHKLSQDSAEEAARLTLQSDYLENKNRLEAANRNLALQQQRFNAFEQHVECHPLTTLYDLLAAVFSFMSFVWLSGLAIEAFLLAVCIARDVNMLRSFQEKKHSTEADRP